MRLVALMVCFVVFTLYCMCGIKIALLKLFLLLMWDWLTCFELFYSHTTTIVRNIWLLFILCSYVGPFLCGCLHICVDCSWVVSLERTHWWISVPEGCFALWRGLATQGCLHILLHCRGPMGVKYAHKSKGGLVWFWIPNSVLAICCKNVLGVRSTRECFSC